FGEHRGIKCDDRDRYRLHRFLRSPRIDNDFLQHRLRSFRSLLRLRPGGDQYGHANFCDELLRAFLMPHWILLIIGIFMRLWDVWFFRSGFGDCHWYSIQNGVAGRSVDLTPQTQQVDVDAGLATGNIQTRAHPVMTPAVWNADHARQYVRSNFGDDFHSVLPAR